MNRLLARLGVCASLLIVAAPAGAAPFGADDPAFSGDGFTTFASGETSEAASNALVAVPGGFVAGGSAKVDEERRFALVRYDANGKPDVTWGDQGRVVVKVGDGVNASIAKVVRLIDGRLLAIGIATSGDRTRLALVRSTAGGAVESNLLTDLTPDAGVRILGAIRLADGHVLVLGTVTDGASDRGFALRLTADGARDAAFGTDGLRLFTRSTGRRTLLFAAREESDGRLTLVGSNDAPTGSAVFVLPLLANGAPDPQRPTIPVADPFAGFRLGAGAATWDAQGRLLLGGTAFPSGGGQAQLYVARLNPDGGADPSYGGGDGIVTTSTNTMSGIGQILVRPDGRAWIAGSTTIGSGPILGAYGHGMVTAAGGFDTTYDGDGTAAGFFGDGGELVQSEYFGEALLDGDRLVLAGRGALSADDGFLDETRYFGLKARQANAQVVPGFGGTDAVGRYSHTTGADVATDPAGRTWIAGSAVEGRYTQLAAWRLTADGELDPAFGSAGYARVDGDPSARGAAILPLNGGGAAIAGSVLVGDEPQFSAVRLTDAGAADTAFSGDGVATVRLRPVAAGSGNAPVCSGSTPILCRDDDGRSGFTGEATDVLADGAGGLYVLGYGGTQANGNRNGVSQLQLVIVHLDAAGALVPGFGTGGVVQIYPKVSSTTYAVGKPLGAVVAGGKLRLSVAWGLPRPAYGSFQFLQLDATTGAFDTTFDGDGFRTIAAPFEPQLRAAAFRPDGSALVTGSGPYVGDYASRVLGSFDATAGLQTAFGSSGFAQRSDPRASLGLSGASPPVELPDGRILTVDAPGLGQPPGSGQLELPVTLFGFTATGEPATDVGVGGVLATARTCTRESPSGLTLGAGGRAVAMSAADARTIRLHAFAAGAPTASISCPPLGSPFLTGTTPLACNVTHTAGSQPFTDERTWLRESSPIPGETGLTYTPTDADAGHLIACRVRVSNPYGAVTSASTPRRVAGALYQQPDDVAAATPEPTPTPTTSTPAPGTSSPPGATTPGATPAPPRFPTTVVKPKALTGVAVLPSAKRCVSKRTLSIRLEAPKGTKLMSAVVRVGSKTVKTVKGSRLKAKIDLRGLPKGTFTVTVVAKTADGRTATDKRRYKTCAKKKAKKKR